MSKIVMLTDSCCDLPKETVEELGIKVLPFTLTVGGKSFLEMYDKSTQEFYKLLEETDEIPKHVKELTATKTAASPAINHFTPLKLGFLGTLFPFTSLTFTDIIILLLLAKIAFSFTRYRNDIAFYHTDSKELECVWINQSNFVKSFCSIS